MPETTTNTQIKFTIKIDPDQAETLASTLRNAGFEFDPENDMIAIDRDLENVIAGVTSGDEVDDAVDSINSLLQVNGETSLLRTHSDNWTLTQRYAALSLANGQLSGLATDHREPWWLIESRDWNDVADGWPQAPWA